MIAKHVACSHVLFNMLYMHLMQQLHFQDKDTIKELVNKFYCDKLSENMDEAASQANGVWKQDTHGVWYLLLIMPVTTDCRFIVCND